MATDVSSISSFEGAAGRDVFLDESEELYQEKKSKIAIKLSYNKLGQTEYTIMFDQYIQPFSSLDHVMDTPQWVHPCDLGVSSLLVSRYLFYRKQISRLWKQGIAPYYSAELMTLLEEQILKAVKDFIEPVNYTLDTY